MVSGKSTAAVKLALRRKKPLLLTLSIRPKFFLGLGFSGPSSAGARLNKVHLAQVVRVAHGVGSFWYP